MSQGYVLVRKEPEMDVAAIPMTAVPSPSTPYIQPAIRPNPSRSISIHATLQLLMNRLTAPTAVIAEDGAIIVTNEPWDRLAKQEGDGGLARGRNYLDYNRKLALRGNRDNLAILDSLADLGAGRQSHCHLALSSDCRASGINLSSLSFGLENFVLVHRYE
jgi:hypothetical protein